MVQLKVYPFEGAGEDTAVFLDLYDTQPIKLNLSIEDITTADATSVFSRAFKVPATRGNNEFFENAFELDGIDFDITIKKPAEILVDGSEFKIGHVRLQKIFANGDLDKIDYELLFLGETRDFSSAIGELTMCQLTFTDFSWDGLPVAYTNADDFASNIGAADVQDSWDAFPQSASHTAGYADGDMIFPLIDHGNAYQGDNLNSPTISIGSNGSQEQSFTHSQHALPAQRFKPMIRAKRIWDQIFENSGYTYESEFLDSEQFLHMYVSAFGNNEQITIGVEQDVGTGPYGSASSNTFEFFEQPNGNNDVNNYLYLSNQVTSSPFYNIGLPDVGGAGDGSWFEAPGDAALGGAYYQFEYGAQVDAQIENSDYGYTPVNAAVQLCIVDAPGGNILYTLDTGNFNSNGNWSSSSYTSQNGGYQPQTGDIFQIFITPEYAYDISSVDQAYWQCIAAPGPYNPARDLDCDYQQIDFIKDVITMFRLVMQPDVLRPNHFIVEPWKDFIGSGTVYDWSDKLIRQKDFVSEPLFNTQSAIIEWTKQEDEDYINKFHQDNNKHAYGWLRFDSQNELLKGAREVEVLGIAPTPIEQIFDTQGSTSHTNPEFILPQIFEVDDNKRLPIKPKTRFLFYNGLVPTNGTTWYFKTGPATQLAYVTYPLVSPYEYWPIENTVGPPPVNTLNLNFSNDTRYFMDPDPGTTYGQIPNTLFDIFWARYITSLYNKFSRRVTAYFTLNNVDLQDLTFDDLIFIDGKYFRPEKIIDAQIGNRTAVKCQLITYKDERVTWLDEPLTGFSVVVNSGDCFGELGNIQVTTDGTPPFTWAIGDPAVANGTYNAPAGQAPYIFTIENAPLGQDTLYVTDANGREAQVAINVQQATTSLVTATSVETDATDCTAPCNGTSTVTPAGGSGSGYTISWNDGNTSFTRQDLCPGTYLYTVYDSNGCQSDVYEIDIQCTVTQNSFEVREFLNNCTASGNISYYADYPGQLSQGDVVTLNERPGCYFIYGSATIPATYTIGTLYNDCTDCEVGENPQQSWKVANCNDPNDTRYVDVNQGPTLSPGYVITIQEPGNTTCYEVIEGSTTVGVWNTDQIFKGCTECASQQGYAYYGVFCDGNSPPVYFASTLQLTLGEIYIVQDGPYAGRCVELVIENPGATTFGNLDISTVYDTCQECLGNPAAPVCTKASATSPSATLTFTRNGIGPFTRQLLATDGTQFFCMDDGSGVFTNGTGAISYSSTACSTDTDCMVGLAVYCHELTGGTTGGSTFWQWIDAQGFTRSLKIPNGQAKKVCAILGTVQYLPLNQGNGTFTVDLLAPCLSDNDCN